MVNMPLFIKAKDDKKNFLDDIAENSHHRTTILTPDGIEVPQESAVLNLAVRNKYRYVVKFPYKNGMPDKERLVVLRRLKALCIPID